MLRAPATFVDRSLRSASGILLLLLLSVLAGCRRQVAQPAPGADDPAERGRKAEVLHRQAQAAAVPEKYDLLRRVFALYDDTAAGQGAYLELVVSLTRDRPPQVAAALDVARRFQERHPTDGRVGECFLQVADAAWVVKDDASRQAALKDWSDHLEARDVADDVPRPALRLDFVRLRLRQERWADAEVAIDTALAEPGVARADQVEILVRKGSLLAEKLGRKEEGRAALQKALDLSRELSKAKTERHGITPEAIEAEIEKLGG